MALGTITINDEVGVVPSAPTFTDRISFAGDSSYPTGGTPGFKALFNSKTGDTRTPLAVLKQNSGGRYVAVYDEANDKLVVYDMSTQAEVPNATNLSGVTFRVAVTSK